MPLSVIVLSIGAFAIGLTEFISVGIIPTIAETFQISEAQAGMVATIYALGVTIGAPSLTLMLVNVNKKYLLLVAMFAFALFNSLAGLTGSYSTLLIARFLSGMFHGLYFGIGATVATRLVDKSKANMAISTMFLGLTVAIALGVPVGSFLTHYFGYSFAYLVVSAVAILSVVGSLILIPSNISDVDNKMSLPEILKIMIIIPRDFRLFYAYFLTIVVWGVVFVAYTFAAPLLRDISGVEPQYIGAYLLLFGVGVTLGNIFGGKVADAVGERKSLLYKTFALVVFHVALYFLIATNIYVAGVLMVIWGFLAFATVPSLQSAVMNLAAKHGPQVVGVASSFNIAAFNIGISSFSYIGALIMESNGVFATVTYSIPFIVFGLLLVIGFYFLTQHHSAYHSVIDDSEDAANNAK